MSVAEVNFVSWPTIDLLETSMNKDLRLRLEWVKSGGSGCELPCYLISERSSHLEGFTDNNDAEVCDEEDRKKQEIFISKNNKLCNK